MLSSTELLKREVAARTAKARAATTPTLHTIRPLRSCASDSTSTEQCRYEQAEYFGIYAYVRPNELELRHIDDQPTYGDAMLYALNHRLDLESHCAQEECSLAAYNAPMFLLRCSGGAVGVMHGCATHFLEHIWTMAARKTTPVWNAPCAPRAWS